MASAVRIGRFSLASLLSLVVIFGIVFVLASLALTHSATAQPASSVSGRVVDASNRGIVRAEVLLRDEVVDVVLHVAVTGKDGAFVLDNVDPDRYLLQVRHVSFLGLDSLLVFSADNRNLELVLEERSVPVSEVVITGDRAIAGISPVAITNLTSREIQRESDMKDIPVLLSSTPSVTHYSENGNGLGYTYLRMRGFDQKRIAVSINGIPQNDPEGFDVFWINFFDLQGSIQDIQVQRGAGSSVYGSTGIGGAVNIVAMPFRPNRFLEINGGVGSYNTRRLTVTAGSGLVADKWTFYGRLSKLDSDGYRNWSWSDYLRYFVGARRVGQRSVLSVLSYGGRQKDGLAYIGIPKEANEGAVDDGFGNLLDRRSNIGEFTRDLERFNQPHVELHHNLQLRPGVDFDQSVFYIRGNGYFDFDGTFRSADYLRLPAGIVADSLRAEPLYSALPGTSLLYRAGLNQWQVGWSPRISWNGSAHRSSIGVQARLHRSARWGRIQESDGLPASVVGGADYQSYNVRGEKSSGLVFARTERPVGSGFTVLGESSINYSRYRVFDEQFYATEFSKGYVFVNPRVGVSWSGSEHTTLYGSVSYASREPRLKALYDGEEAGGGSQPQFETNADDSFNYDKPLVRPEHVVNVELGSTIRISRARAALNVFLMRFQDEIVPSGGLDQFGIPRTGNADQSTHAGIEFDGELRISRTIDVFGSATVSRHRFVSFAEYQLGATDIELVERDGNPIAGFPDYIGNLGIAIQHGGLGGSISARYVGKQYVDNAGKTAGDQNVVDPHVLANANLRYYFTGKMQGLQLSLDVNNVLNAKVLQFGNAGFGAPQFFPAATRNVFVGVRYQID